MVKLAEQFGHATGKGTALRSAIDKPDPTRMKTSFESHERGSILVGAVFEAFFQTYQERIQDLLRIATGGSGRLPQGDLHPDLVNRISREATSTANATLRMCIRAFDYLPPVDITFGDYLRAMVTADYELNPIDETGLRRQMIEAFRARGIYPTGISSLSEESLRWERFGEVTPTSPRLLADVLGAVNAKLVQEAAETSRNSAYDKGIPLPPDEDDYGKMPQSAGRYAAIYNWANSNRTLLRLAPGNFEIAGVHSSFRVAQDGQLLMETVIQLAQKATKGKKDPDLGGMPFRGGTTVVVKANGAIQYVISKPLVHAHLPAGIKETASARLTAQANYVALLDETDCYHIWKDRKFQENRILNRMTLAALHWNGM